MNDIQKTKTFREVRISLDERTGNFYIRRLQDFGQVVLSPKQLSALKRVIQRIEGYDYKRV